MKLISLIKKDGIIKSIWILDRNNYSCLMFFLVPVKPCPLPDETPNGFYQIIHGIDLVFGTTIQYFCNSGYVDLVQLDTSTII